MCTPLCTCIKGMSSLGTQGSRNTEMRCLAVLPRTINVVKWGQWTLHWSETKGFSLPSCVHHSAQASSAGHTGEHRDHRRQKWDVLQYSLGQFMWSSGINGHPIGRGRSDLACPHVYTTLHMHQVHVKVGNTESTEYWNEMSCSVSQDNWCGQRGSMDTPLVGDEGI